VLKRCRNRSLTRAARIRCYRFEARSAPSGVRAPRSDSGCAGGSGADGGESFAGFRRGSFHFSRAAVGAYQPADAGAILELHAVEAERTLDDFELFHTDWSLSPFGAFRAIHKCLHHAARLVGGVGFGEHGYARFDGGGEGQILPLPDQVLLKADGVRAGIEN
jgi:hypothetical protein